MANQTNLLKCDEAAERLGLSVSTLAKMRVRGDGPVFVKLGGKKVAYAETDLNEWIQVNRRRSTSEAPD